MKSIQIKELIESKLSITVWSLYKITSDSFVFQFSGIDDNDRKQIIELIKPYCNAEFENNLDLIVTI